MKTRFLSILVLLLVAAQGAVAQSADNTVIDLTVVEAGKQWSFDMPDSDVEVQVEYKAVTSTALTYNGEAVSGDPITVVMGTEEDFIDKLKATVLDETQNPANVESPTFTYTSSNPEVLAFGDNGAASGALADIRFLKAGEATLTVQFEGTDDLGRSSATVTLNIEEPGYTISLKSGTDDANSWNAKADDADQFTSLPLEGVKASQTVTIKYDGNRKVKSVKAKKKAAADEPATLSLNLTNPTVGQVIGSDGKNYAATATLPDGVTKVAMIAYVSGSNGLAIALADEGEMKWDTAVTTAAAHTPVFSNGTWRLPSKDEWQQMFSAFSGYSELQTAITNSGGTALLTDKEYWSSTENPNYTEQALCMFIDAYEEKEVFFGSGRMKGATNVLVRAVIAF